MINTSDPVGFMPFGLVSSLNHPDVTSTDFQKNSFHCSTDKTVCSKQFKYDWILRNDANYREELFYNKKLSINSKGSKYESIFQTSYQCENDILLTMWGQFYVENENRMSHFNEIENQQVYENPFNCLCIFNTNYLQVFTDLGENYVSTLPFKVTAVWSSKFGMLLQKSVIPDTISRTQKVDNDKGLTDTNPSYVYSLTHPLDDVHPVLIKHGRISYFDDRHLKIINVQSNPSLALLFNEETKLHSIYQVRKASYEEYQTIHYNDDENSIFINSALTNKTKLLSTGKKDKLFINSIGVSNSPYRSRTTSYATNCSGNFSFSSQYMSRSQSPMATISRCQSPSNPLNTLSGTGFQNKSTCNILGLSIGSIEPRRENIGYLNKHLTYSSIGVIAPTVCLDHIWTENISQIKKNKEPSSKIFLTTNLIGQTYFCYLLHDQALLGLIRIENSSDPEHTVLGLVTYLAAKDAINVPNLHMMIIIEPNGNLAMYSGVSFVGKLHIPLISHNVLGNSHLMSSFYENEQLSPYPRRSSLISPNKSSTPDFKFDEGLHLLSPVSKISTQLHSSDSMISNNSMRLRSSVSNKFIVESGDNSFLKIVLPTHKASPLVLQSLKTLQNILPRELAMQFLIKWYVARNAPGPQDLSTHQEWNLFLSSFFTFFDYDVNKLHKSVISSVDLTSYYRSITVSKKQKTLNTGTPDDWSYVSLTEINTDTQNFLWTKIGLTKLKEHKNQEIYPVIEPKNLKIININILSTIYMHLPNVFFSLHLLYEELKISCNMSSSLFNLAKLLYQLSMDLNLPRYRQHYFSDYLVLGENNVSFQSDNSEMESISVPNFIECCMPNIFSILYNIFSCSKNYMYPHVLHINPKSINIIKLFSIFKNKKNIEIIDLDHLLKVIKNPVIESQLPSQERLKEESIIQCFKKEMSTYELENLPLAVHYIISSFIHQYKEKPPSTWPSCIYEIIDRQDLGVLHNNDSLKNHVNSILRYKHKNNEPHAKENKFNDGMEFDYTILKLRFKADHRVQEVRKLLNSSQPIKIAISQKSDISDHEFIEEQEKFLLSLCTRTMALPIGRGMFTLQTSMPMNTEQLPIPRLCLTGKAPPRGTLVELTHIDVPSNMNLWPLFHNGVATGLCISSRASNVDSTWIVYNKQQQNELGVEHSGFLMALGLNGHLKNLAPFSMYEYLVECHETTSVGLLLGLSATHRSSMDVSMTKLLSLHVETLLPPTSIELNVQQNVQVAALMGVGLVYQQTNHRHIAYALLSEIGRPPGPEMKNSIDRESYSLAAGLALGLVVLGSGEETDLPYLPETLHYYMVGGNTKAFRGAQKDKYKSPSYQIREGNSINVDVTSPGATIALGLMYLRSNNSAVAEWMSAPNTQYLLDFIRPDLLLLRILSKSLILWDEIEPSKTWISSHVPAIVSKYKLQKPTCNIAEPVDLETINQVYCNIIAGACMAVGIKYAGTENYIAFKTLLHFLKMFIALSKKSVAELAGKGTIETCLDIVLLSASIVMAGTGNLELLKVCRYARSRVGLTSSNVTYGSHVATHMALGFLFLGGGCYTLSNDPSSVAALIISLFPKFPTHSNDNRYHLQALRHFYVLASQPRLLLPKDIDNNNFCFLRIKITYKSSVKKDGLNVMLKAPCLLPQLDCLEKIELDDDRYWKITFNKNNFDQLRSILNSNSILKVKQRAGCLSYEEDPQGFRTLLAQTLTTEDNVTWIASLKQIISFTRNKMVLNFISEFLMKADENILEKCDKYCTNATNIKLKKKYLAYFKMYCEDFNAMSMYKKISHDRSIIERYCLQSMTTITYECVIKDKIKLFPIWINIFKNMSTLKDRSRSHIITQMKLLQLLGLKYFDPQQSNILLDTEIVLSNKQDINELMDACEKELAILWNCILRGGCTSLPVETLEKYINYTINYNLPSLVEILTDNYKEQNFHNQDVSCLQVHEMYRRNRLFNSHIK